MQTEEWKNESPLHPIPHPPPKIEKVDKDLRAVLPPSWLLVQLSFSKKRHARKKLTQRSQLDTIVVKSLDGSPSIG